MMKMWSKRIVWVMLAALLVSACGNGEAPEAGAEQAAAGEEGDASDEAASEEVETEDEDSAQGAEGFADVIAYMEETTEGTADVLYENDEPQVHELDAISVTLDAYTLVALDDFHTDYSIPFNDSTTRRMAG